MPQNYAEARKLLERAASHNDIEGRYLLGQLYLEGRGKMIDRPEVYRCQRFLDTIVIRFRNPRY